MQKQTSNQSTPNKQVGGGFSSNANTQNAAREEEELNAGQEEESEDEDITEAEEDTDPTLDENDLEENNLSDEEADNIEWKPDSESNR
jgi:hypothetical protein